MAETRKVATGNVGTVSALTRSKSVKTDTKPGPQPGDPTFLGRRLPAEVIPLVQLAAGASLTLNPASIVATLQLVLKFIFSSTSAVPAPTSNDWGELVQRLQVDAALEKAASETLSPGEQARLLFAGATTIFKTILRSKITLEAVQHDLALVVQLPAGLVDAILQTVKSVSNKWNNLTDEMSEGDVPGAVLEHLDGALEWRVEVTISTSQLQRVLLPAIQLRVKTPLSACQS